MSKISIQGDPSGTGTLTVAAPNTNSNFTLTLPSETGTLLTTGSAVPVTAGGTGATTLTANNVILGNGTSAVTFVAPGTNGNILTSNGTTWTSAAAASSGITAGAMNVYTSPATWTKPASVKFIRVTVVSAGGNWTSPGSGSTGNTSSFGPFVSCTGGTGNGPGSPTAANPKAGGTSTGADWNLSGTAGVSTPYYFGSQGTGGGSLLTIAPGGTGSANYGGGGSGGQSNTCNAAPSGAGGGATGIKYISAPAIPGPVAVTVGAGGTPSPSQNGGGGGIVIVEEFS